MRTDAEIKEVATKIKSAVLQINEWGTAVLMSDGKEYEITDERLQKALIKENWNDLPEV